MGIRNSKKKKTPAQQEAAARAAVDKADAAYNANLAKLSKLQDNYKFTGRDHHRMMQRRALDRGRATQMARTVKRLKAKTANNAAWSGGRRRKRKTRRRHHRRQTQNPPPSSPPQTQNPPPPPSPVNFYFILIYNI